MTLNTDVRKIKNPKAGILVPLIENFMSECAVEIDSPEDLKFLYELQEKVMRRENDRRTEGLGYYSPSSLGEHCTRKAYLGRHAVRAGGTKSPYDFRAHYFFVTGNFLHLKWQFILWKMERWIANSAIFQIHGLEVPIASKHGDHRGTVDVVASVYGEPFVIDAKGLNVFSAKKISYGNVPVTYRTQVVDYIILWNSQKVRPFRIERGILLVENKGGGKDLIQESIISLKRDGERARRRLAVLRAFEEKGEMPPPTCRSLKDKAFVKCQFRAICHDEVERVYKKDTTKLREGLASAEAEPTTAERVRAILKKGVK